MTNNTSREQFIANLLSIGRTAILRRYRSLGIRLGNIKDTRELVELLWQIEAVNLRHAGK